MGDSTFSLVEPMRIDAGVRAIIPYQSVAARHGRAVIDRRTIHVHDLRADAETEFPEDRKSRGATERSNYARHAVAARGCCDRSDH